MVLDTVVYPFPLTGSGGIVFWVSMGLLAAAVAGIAWFAFLHFRKEAKREEKKREKQVPVDEL